MQQRIMAVQSAGELAGPVRDALNRQAFNVMYVEGLANARRAVIEARPDLVLIGIASWTKDVEELLCEFSNFKSTRSSRKIILASTAGVDDRALPLNHIPTNESARSSVRAIESDERWIVPLPQVLLQSLPRCGKNV